jgi:DNA-binding NtrC family response regulator
MLPGSILIIDDDRDVLETARMFLKQEFTIVKIEESPEKNSISTQVGGKSMSFSLDMNFKKGVNDGEEGLYWLQQILKLDAQAVVVLITAYGECGSQPLRR